MGTIRLRRSVMLALTAVMALSVACKGDDKGDDTSTDDTGTPTGDLSIEITSPADGATVEVTTTLTFTVEGITLDPDNIGGANVEGDGHVHVYVDGEYYTAVGTTSAEVSGLLPGDHTLEVRLAENDHSELGVSDSVSVSVADEGTPLVAITSPNYGDAFDDSAVFLEFTVLNFELSSGVGGAPADGEGHYHISVDGSYFDYGYDSAGAWATRLTEGDHILGVELVNNDHSSLSPSIMDAVSVTINDGARYVEITSPSNDATVNSSSYEIAVSASNFTLDDSAIGDAPEDGIGHYHVYLDGAYYTASGNDSVWITDVDPGDHLVSVVLAGNEHAEWSAVDYVRINSDSDRPGISITSPPEGESISSDATVTVSIENFTLDPDAVGTAPVDGEGHWHVFVDGDYQNYSTEDSISISGLSSGEHQIMVELYNNDHTELDDRVLDTVNVNVP